MHVVNILLLHHDIFITTAVQFDTRKNERFLVFPQSQRETVSY